MKFKNNLVLIFVILFIVSCKEKGKNNTIENMIVDRIDQKCNDTNNCIIAIKDLTNFKWDKMYAFNYPVSLEVINKAINNKYDHYEEFTRPIIFLEKGKIVHYENNPSDIESLINKQIVFDFPDSLKYGTYGYDATFKVEKKEFKKGYYYELHSR